MILLTAITLQATACKVDVAGSLSATFTYDANGNMISQSGKFSDIDYERRNLPTWFHTTGGPDVKAFYNANAHRPTLYALCALRYANSLAS